MKRRLIFPPLLAAAALMAAMLPQRARAVSFDSDDFLIVGREGSEGIHVFDHDFTPKDRLVTIAAMGGSGIDFDSQGNVVYVGISPRQILVKNTTPTQHTSTPVANGAGDVVVAPNGNYIVASSTIQERTPDGAIVRSFGSGGYSSVAILPGNILWAGTHNVNAPGQDIQVYDLNTGQLINSLPLHVPAGQLYVGDIFYSKLTNTVLMGNGRADSNIPGATAAAFELDLAGNLLRTFSTPPSSTAVYNFINSNGITRGPNGDVFATDHSDMHPTRLGHWKADGTFVGYVPAQTAFTLANPQGILWAGNFVPEPATASLLIGGIGYVHLALRRRRQA